MSDKRGGFSAIEIPLHKEFSFKSPSLALSTAPFISTTVLLCIIVLPVFFSSPDTILQALIVQKQIKLEILFCFFPKTIGTHIENEIFLQ